MKDKLVPLLLLNPNNKLKHGKKAKHLKTGEVGQYQAQFCRGRRSRQLDRQIASLEKRISRVEKEAS